MTAPHTSSPLGNLCQNSDVHASKALEHSGWSPTAHTVTLPLSMFMSVLKRQVQSPSLREL